MSETIPTGLLPDSNEVPWHVAILSLVPLALSVMTQPCGRFLGLSAKYRIWLRGSPILCVLDMILFAFFVCRDVVLGVRNLREAIRAQLQFRFREDDGSPSSFRSVQLAEQRPVARMMVTIVCGIPCRTFKLVAMKHMPLTKTIAVTYMLSLVFGELVRYYGKLAHQGDAKQPLSPAPHIARFVLFPALVMHNTVACFVFFKSLIWDLVPFDFHPFVLYICCYLMLMSSACFVMTMNSPPREDYSDLDGTFASVVISGWHWSLGVIISATMVSCWITWDWVAEGLLDTPLWLAVPIWALYFPIYSIMTCCTFLGVGFWVVQSWKALLYVARRGLDVDFPGEVGAVRSELLRMSLFTIGITLFSYAYLYDPKGTFMPSWAGFFGIKRIQ